MLHHKVTSDEGLIYFSENGYEMPDPMGSSCKSLRYRHFLWKLIEWSKEENESTQRGEEVA